MSSVNWGYVLIALYSVIIILYLSQIAHILLEIADKVNKKGDK